MRMGKKKDELLMPEIKSYDPVSKKSGKLKGGKGKKSRVIKHKAVKFKDLSKQSYEKVQEMDSKVAKGPEKICGAGMIKDLPRIELEK